jgi:thiol-disulfide isomerase/thioredoxin
MKLDQKYFIPFLAIMAVVTAFLIAFFTASSQKGQREAFRQAISQQDSLRNEYMPYINRDDSLTIASVTAQKKIVVLDFWATWSNFSVDVHRELADLVTEYPQHLVVVAAVVKEQPDKITSYLERHDFPFHFVYGTAVFNKYQVPGMPTGIIYGQDGELKDVYFGYSDSTQYNRLRTLIEDGS